MRPTDVPKVQHSQDDAWIEAAVTIQDRMRPETLLTEKVAAKATEQQLEPQPDESIYIEPLATITQVARPKAEVPLATKQELPKPEVPAKIMLSPAQEMPAPVVINRITIPKRLDSLKDDKPTTIPLETITEPHIITAKLPEIVHIPSLKPNNTPAEVPSLEETELRPLEVMDATEEDAISLSEYVEPILEDTEPEVDWVEMAIRDILGEDTKLPDIFSKPISVEIPDFIPEWHPESEEKSEVQTVLAAELETELTPYLEPLNEEEGKTVITLATTIIETARGLQHQLKQEGFDALNLKPEIEELKQVCIELLETLGIPIDDEAIESFLHFILQDEPPPLEASGQTHSLNEEGTHEQKQNSQTVLSKLARLIRRRPFLHNLLGEIALKFKGITSLSGLRKTPLLSSNLD